LPYGYFLAKPIKNKARVLTIPAKYNPYTWWALVVVRAIMMTAIQMKRIVAKIDAYFIWLLYHKKSASAKE